MTPMTTRSIKEAKARESYRGLVALVTKLEGTLLELLAHPDATLEQIDEARKHYADLKKRMRETRAVMKQHGILRSWD